jgi:hypothetical protein|tara:strand:+ start:307 stop:828 length:522 start_codon:yes stop_codon:yes gene_type:complete
MKILFLTICLTFALNITSAKAENFSFDKGKITFDAPDDFAALSPEIISIKYPSTHRPKFVIGNDSAKTTIAYDIKQHNISKTPIDAVRQKLTEGLERSIPGLEWKKNTVLTFKGREWIYFEMTSNAIDTGIYNIMLFTPYGKKMLAFNFNSTIDEIEQYKPVFYKSIESIAVK